MSEIKNKVVIITGASSGLGEATAISPGAIATELLTTISDRDTAARLNAFYKIAIDADAIARAIAKAIEQPGDVDVNEMIIRPTRQEL